MAPESSMHGHSFGRKVELVIGTSSVRLRSNFPEIPESSMHGFPSLLCMVIHLVEKSN